MKLRFHWMLPKSGEVGTPTPLAAARYRVEAAAPGSPGAVPRREGWVRFARAAEEAGIDSLLISFSSYEPEPLITAGVLGQATEQLAYIVAVRSGLLAPAFLVQQLNTLSGFIGGRVSLNLVAGSSRLEQHSYGDFLAHDERYARADEFLQVCNALWEAGPGGPGVDHAGRYYRNEGGGLHVPFLGRDGRSAPEIYVSGHSEAAQRVAAQRATCWLRVVDRPEDLRAGVEQARARGLEVCLRAGILCRPSRAEAEDVLHELLHDPVVSSRFQGTSVKDDSQMYREAAAATAWRSPTLWTGLAPVRGPVWTTLVGTPDELAAAFLEYRRIGVSQFILSGWPELEEVTTFGREVLPRVRAGEA